MSDVSKRLQEIIYEGCHINKWWVEKISIQKEHVHMLIQIKPRASISEVMNKVKGVSSRLLKKEFLWGDKFWFEGFLAVTVEEVDEKVVKRYIASQ